MFRRLPYSFVVVLTDIPETIRDSVHVDMVMKPLSASGSLELATEWLLFDISNPGEYVWGKEFLNLIPNTPEFTAEVLAGNKILIIRSEDRIVL